MNVYKKIIISCHDSFIKSFKCSANQWIKSQNRYCVNRYSTKVGNGKQVPIKPTPSRRQVWVSGSECIYYNLALEDWLYHNADFEQCEYLLLWRNQPAVVVGKHQNPWLEAHVGGARGGGVQVARRASGGGTVYHDLGNLNLSFLCSRARYDRRRNLELVVSAIQACGDVYVTINKRDDIILNQMYKISGTASKLGRTQAYHHMTLLHSVDMEVMHKFLASPLSAASTKATASVPAAVRNLVEDLPSLTVDGLVDALTQQFSTQVLPGNCDITQVNPSDETQFPGVENTWQTLTSWPWVFGKTPKFSISRSFTGHVFRNKQCSISIDLLVEKGKISDVKIEDQTNVMEGLLTLVLAFYKEHLIGEEIRLDNLISVKEQFVKFCDIVFVDKGNENYMTAMWLSERLNSCLDFL